MTETARDHGELVVLSTDECLARLGGTPVGRVAFVADGGPVILPVNHRLVGRSVVFRTAAGSKLDAAAFERPVAFEVDGYDEAGRTGWSVLVKGRLEPVEGDDIEQLRTAELDAWADAVERDRWVRVVPEEITGRRLDR